MTFIHKEIPTGIINWTNKVFTLANTPNLDYDFDVWKDWLIETWFTIVWTTLTFSIAPIYSVFLDYATWTSTTIDYWQDEFLDIKTEVWDLIGTTSWSTTFTSAKIWKKINAKINEVIRWRITSLLNPQIIYRAWKLPFNEDKVWFRIKAWWILTTILNVWDVTGYLDTTNIYPAWYLQIGGDLVKYTWVTPTTITWVIWQTVEHLVSETCIQLYEMPVNFEKTIIVKWILEWESGRYKEIPFDSSESMWFCYNIYTYWDKKLIKVIWLTSDNLINIEYIKKVYDLVNDTDLCILPNYYWTKVIAPLVAWEYMLQKGFPTAQAVLLSWYTGLQNMFQFFTNPTNQTKTTLKATSYSFNSLRRY